MSLREFKMNKLKLIATTIIGLLMVALLVSRIVDYFSTKKDGAANFPNKVDAVKNSEVPKQALTVKNEDNKKGVTLDQDPKKWLSDLANSSSKISGYVDGIKSPSIDFSFSNGHMEVMQPGVSPFASGAIKNYSSADSTCIGFEKEDTLGAAYESGGRSANKKMPMLQFMACVAAREFTIPVGSRVPDGMPKSAGEIDFHVMPGERFLLISSDVWFKPAMYRVSPQ
jgi:hypothetical protein